MAPTLDLTSFRILTQQDLVTRLSTAADGTEANGQSQTASLSRDGRYVVFESDASNLVVGDINGTRDIFRRDLVTGEIVRVSIAADHAEANSSSGNSSISADGRYVVFTSDATNLVSGDTNGCADIFRKDLVTGEIVRVSADGLDNIGNANSDYAQISADGRYVVFESDSSNLVANDTNGTVDIFRKDVVTGEIVRVSTTTTDGQLDNGSSSAQISEDGRLILFESEDASGVNQIYLKDVETGSLTLVSTGADRTPGDQSSEDAQLSADGRYVVFASGAANLVAGDTNGTDDIYRKDLVTGEIVRVSEIADWTQANAQSTNASISADGRYVTFESKANNLVAGDTNTSSDVFRKDLVTGEIIRLSTTSHPAQGHEQFNAGSQSAALSADGRYVMFQSAAGNLVPGSPSTFDRVFLKDLESGTSLQVSFDSNGVAGNEASRNAVFSADGRFAFFTSNASNLVTGDTNGAGDIFRKDLTTGAVIRVSEASDGSQVNGSSDFAHASADGRYVLFQSSATNLVAGDTNQRTDVFWKDLETGIVQRMSTSISGIEGDRNSFTADLSSNGQTVLFTSDATNLVPNDTNGQTDIFLKNMATGALTIVSVTEGGIQANGFSNGAHLTADGKHLVFYSAATNLVSGDANGVADVFVKDLVNGTIVRASTSASGDEANGASFNCQIIADGRYVVFRSDASNLVEGDTNGRPDIFLKDLDTGDLVRVSTASNGTQANDGSSGPQLSADGRYVVFESEATNLVPGDTNHSSDLFRKDLLTGELVRLSEFDTDAQGNEQANAGSTDAWMSTDGIFAVFTGDADNLASGDTNNASDISSWILRSRKCRR